MRRSLNITNKSLVNKLTVDSTDAPLDIPGSDSSVPFLVVEVIKLPLSPTVVSKYLSG
jgi:hypothetical protein